jgi:hypothetical protein
MKKAATALCTAALIAAVPATGIASAAGSGDAPAAHAAKNKKKLKKCIKTAQSRYQGPAYTKAVKKCHKKYG